MVDKNFSIMDFDKAASLALIIPDDFANSDLLSVTLNLLPKAEQSVFK